MAFLCVFCGSRLGHRAIYAEAARQLGTSLAERKLGLVYGGGHIGLMGVLADAVLEAGGQVIGVIPASMVESELAHGGLSELIVVDTMHQRKARMAEIADAFAVIPGGYGTLDETFEILTWAQLGLHDKPIALLNVAGYFDPLLAWTERSVLEGFVKRDNLNLLRVAEHPEQLLALLFDEPSPAESSPAP